MPAAPHTGVRQVNRTVIYVRADGNMVPAVITALGAGNLVDLRVGQHGETYSDVDHMANRNDTNVWFFGSRAHHA